MNFRERKLYLGGVAAEELVERFGSPLYVYEAATIRRQARRIREAFASLASFRPFYAMKANDNLAILRLIEGQGFGCDCVSPGEVFLARHAGFDAHDLWFTSSSVSDDDLLALDDPEIVVNLNSMSEVDRVIRLGLQNPIAFRVNPDVGAGHHKDVVTGGFGVKFGIDLAEIDDARGVAQSAGLQVVGLHAHIGSGVADPAPLLESARRLVSLVDDFPTLRFLNFGGGIAVPYRPGERDFPIAEYGAGLSRIAGDVLADRGISAILEPGRYVVAESGTLLTRVTSKRISAGYEWIGVDSGFNHLVRPSKYGSYHHIVNATNGSDADLRENASPAATGGEEAIVAGNLCESGDVFTREPDGIHPRRLPRTSEGDVLALCDAGAYGFSMASHYNARLLPAEVLVEDGEPRVIRKRQDYEELLRGQE